MTLSDPRNLSLLLASAVLATASPAFAQSGEEGDGAPHIAVAQEDDGSLVLEFEVDAGLNLSTALPTITLDVNLDSFLSDPTTGTFIFRSAPLGDRPDPFAPLAPNEDLGFVSEVEGALEEGAALNVGVSVRLLSSDEGFSATSGGEDIFTSANGFVFDLGNAFDVHPTYQLTADSADFTGSVSASFEVFETASGAVIGGYNLVLDTQPIPEPTTAVLAGAMGLLVLRRRRSA